MEKYGIIYLGVITMRAINDIMAKRDQIVSIASHYKFSNVRLFGSVLREEEKAESDIDFLVECSDDCSLFDLISLKNDLEEILGRKIDVVTPDSVHWTIKDKILQEARPI
ncbi:putative nucleotidyltransferase [Desulfitobacterium dichloroeliminans LMG P-21439]|uniref:Putative nucleotidyltransferase n=2 Tax=Desulfitobacterium dichloroeliminans TaxID=233055 RepID=L0F5A9_DESDL|nr:putative nucleotidyltransferase [Desulfitobacterium dichloroeliminans LMG P-21439]